VAKKKKTATGDVADVTVEILRSIRDEIAGLRQDTNARFKRVEAGLQEVRDGVQEVRAGLQEVRAEIRVLREDIESLETATIRGFEGVSARLDHIVEFSGERWRDHEDRIRRLEGQAGR
jgi:methyl-accepting chemotaxis protein